MENLNTRITELTENLIYYEEIINRMRAELHILNISRPTPFSDQHREHLIRSIAVYNEEMAKLRSELNQLIMLYTQLITPRTQFGKKKKKTNSRR